MSFEREYVDKIVVIKSVRCMTAVLGKLGVYQSRLKTAHPSHRSGEPHWYSYGVGLKECKDWVELFFDRKQRRKEHAHISIDPTLVSQYCPCCNRAHN